MAKDKSAEDTISENEYTIRMRSASTQPEEDSPGDSESDAETEFEMGLEYFPDEKNDPEENIEQPISKFKEIPETAKIISSDQPAPWMDRNTVSDTH